MIFSTSSTCVWWSLWVYEQLKTTGTEAERKVVMKPTRAKVAFIRQWSLWLGPRISMKPNIQLCGCCAGCDVG